MRRKQPSYWPQFKVDQGFLDLMVASSLSLRGIYNAQTYFRIWRVRIIVWTVVCWFIGLVSAGVTGMLIGAVAGPVMPLVLLYLTFVVPLIAAYMLGLAIGICWIWFCGWLLIQMLFRW
jgi:hypothetical protein